jgi:hypothetical protein
LECPLYDGNALYGFWGHRQHNFLTLPACKQETDCLIKGVVSPELSVIGFMAISKSSHQPVVFSYQQIGTLGKSTQLGMKWKADIRNGT